MKKVCNSFIPGIIYLLVLTLFLVSCDRNRGKSDAYGNFETDETVVSSEVAGLLTDFSLKLGDNIKEGKLVAIVDTTYMSLQIKELESQIQSVATKRINVHSQADVIKEQIANTKIEQGRIIRMFADKAATQQQLDNINGQVRVLEKQLNSTNTQFVSIEKEMEVLAARMDVLKESLRKCYVKSPINGVVLEKYIEKGEIVSPGKAIIKVADISSMDLRVYVSGQQLPSVKLGQQVEVLIDEDNKSNRSLTGEVIWISSSSEFTPKIIQTKEERVKLVYAVKIRVKNDGSLKIGMPAEVNFSSGANL